MMPKVFIILINWNSWDFTKDCLISLRDLGYDNYQIIVVDNGSQEVEKKKARDFSVTEGGFILIENGENAGFSGGNNVGIKYALNNKADYVLLLNNDTIVEDKHFLKKLVEASEANKKVGIVGPKIYYWPAGPTKDKQEDVLRRGGSTVMSLPSNGSGQIFARGAKIWFGGGKLNWLKTEGIHLTSESAMEVDFITGCCLLIKKEVIDKIGLMSEEFFLYFEDSDWCLRALQAGYRCFYEPAAWIWHKVSSTTKEFSYVFIYYNTRNGLLMAWRHNGFLKRLIVLGLAIWIIIKQSVKLAVGYKKEWSKAMFWGAIDFLKGKFGKMK